MDKPTSSRWRGQANWYGVESWRSLVWFAVFALGASAAGVWLEVIPVAAALACGASACFFFAGYIYRAWIVFHDRRPRMRTLWLKEDRWESGGDGHGP